MAARTRCLLSAGFLRISNESKTQQQPGAGDLCRNIFGNIYVSVAIIYRSNVQILRLSAGGECLKLLLSYSTIQTFKIRGKSAKSKQSIYADAEEI